MTHIRYPIAAGICWVACLTLVILMLRRKELWRSPAMIALCASFGCQAMYLTLSTPKRWTGSLFGVVTWYNVSVQLWMISAIVCQQLLLAYWLHPSDRANLSFWRRLVPLGTALAAMVVLFFIASGREQPHNTFDKPGEQPFFVAYQLVYLTAYSFGKISVTVACWRYQFRTTDLWVRFGLQVAAAGAAIDLLYPVGRLADVFLVQHGWNGVRWSDISRTCLTVGIALNVIGWTAPLWGPRLSAATAWLRDYLKYRRLEHLWSAVTASQPEVVLAMPPRRGMDTLRNLRFHLHRRVVEIQDACLALTRADTQGTAPRGATGLRSSALEAAAHIHGALARADHRDGRPPRSSASGWVLSSPDGFDEVTWLVEVSRALARLDAAGRLADPRGFEGR